VLVFDDKLMQIIPEEISAHSSTIAIVDAKEGAFWPMLLLEIL